MAREHGPYSVAFPVDFTSKGDTTRDAFRKHMDEITRIYGILTGLDADTLDSSAVSEMLQKHVNSTNPHPNWTPSVSWANITNKPSLGDLSGNLAASRVVGALTGATIPSGNVTGLEAFVKSKIPESKESGITEESVSKDGYIEFANGLIIQWGIKQSSVDKGIGRAIFSKAFPTQCFVVVGCTYCHDGQVNGKDYGGSYCKFQVTEWDNKGFGFNTSTEYLDNNWHGYASYIAIGV